MQPTNLPHKQVKTRPQQASQDLLTRIKTLSSYRQAQLTQATLHPIHPAVELVVPAGMAGGNPHLREKREKIWPGSRRAFSYGLPDSSCNLRSAIIFATASRSACQIVPSSSRIWST